MRDSAVGRSACSLAANEFITLIKRNSLQCD